MTKPGLKKVQFRSIFFGVACSIAVLTIRSAECVSFTRDSSFRASFVDRYTELLFGESAPSLPPSPEESERSRTSAETAVKVGSVRKNFPVIEAKVGYFFFQNEILSNVVFQISEPTLSVS